MAKKSPLDDLTAEQLVQLEAMIKNPMAMAQELSAVALRAAAERMARPVLARLPSEPGWRVLVSDVDLANQQAKVRLVAVHAWGFDQKCLFVQPDKATVAPKTMMELLLERAIAENNPIASLAGPYAGTLAGLPSPDPWPLDAEGKRIGPMIVAIVDPTITDADALKRFDAVMQENIAKLSALTASL